MSQKRVVVAPLDWGLGHATRCIPIIRALQKRNCEIIVASSGSALNLLKTEFPALHFEELVSYKATYSKIIPLMAKVFLQMPRFLVAIQKEHAQLEAIVTHFHPNLIISDNRYGCWSKRVPSVFITHQLNIQMPSLLVWLQPLIRFFNAQFVRRFSACWIPDTEGEKSLSGSLSESKLSHSKRIGFLSALEKNLDTLEPHMKFPPLAVLLSGPEPQRTVLENIIRPQLKAFDQKAILIRGVVESKTKWSQEGNLQIVNFLTSEMLSKVMRDAEVVIARSGYSTIMDVAALNKKAIFIPTPGQTEQEYLARRLMDKRICLCMPQKNFVLPEALERSKGFSGFSNIEVSTNLLSQALDELLAV